MKQAFQIISRMKGYTALSLLGLIISLSGTVIISRYLYQEWTIDHFMPNLERTYVLVTNFMDGGISEGSVGMNYVFDSDFFSPVEGQSEIEIYCDFMLRKDFPVSVDGQEASQKRYFGCKTMARAIATRFCIPPESSPGNLVSAPCRLTRAKQFSARFFLSS